MQLEVVTAPELTERELVEGCVRGDPAAQRMLFRREFARVNATVYRVMGNTRETDDIVQETFIAAFRALPRFRHDSKLSTWLTRIAVRLAYSALAARKRAPLSLDVVDASDEVSVADRARGREGLRRLYAALARLKPDARMAFALYAIDGRSIAEVAELTRCSSLAAKLRIWRARKDIERMAKADPILAEFVVDKEAP